MKKVLSILVAAMMLFSICSVCASAAVNDAVLGLKVTATADSYNPGDVVTFEVSYEATSEIGNVGVCTLHIGFDGDVFEPIETIGTGLTLDTATSVILTGYALDGKISPANSFVQLKGAIADSDTAKGWDSSLKIALTKAPGSALFDASTETKVLAFQLKVKDSAAGGNYAIGITQGSIDDYSTSVDEELGAINGPSGPDYGFSASKIFDCVDCTVAIAGGGSTEEPTTPTITGIKNVDTKVQWQEAGSNYLNIGFEGAISGFTAEEAATVVATISEIGFEFSTTDSTLATSSKATTKVVYDFTSDGTGYKFRAVVRKAMTDADAAGEITHNIYARAFVTFGETTLKASDIISTTIYDEYTDGVSKGLATLAANLG